MEIFSCEGQGREFSVCFVCFSSVSSKKAGFPPERQPFVPYRFVIFWDSVLEVKFVKSSRAVTPSSAGIEVHAEALPCGPKSSGRRDVSWQLTLGCWDSSVPASQTSGHLHDCSQGTDHRPLSIVAAGTCFLWGRVRPGPAGLAWLAALKAHGPTAGTARCPARK